MKWITIALLTTINSLISVQAQAKTDINKQLIRAIKDNKPKVIKKILKKGVQIDRPSLHGRTPLMHACENGFKSKLIPPDMPQCCHEDWENDGSWRPLYDKLLDNRREIISLLIEAGADVNWQDSNGYTPLFIACQMNNDLKKVALLIKAGSDVNAQSQDGSTALMEAIKDGKIETARLLMAAGADIHLCDQAGRNALMHAAEWNTELVSLLLQAKADVNARDNEGKTALKIALDWDHKDIAGLLSKYRATV